MGIRIQKFLSHAGVASRRRAEALMVEGRVRVNGEVVTSLGRRVHPGTDRVELDGREVVAAAYRWVLLHKVAGTVTTRSDPGGMPTVYDGLPKELEGLAYVGRLDVETEGLLLLTNEGDTVHGLLHPSFEVEREYRVEVVGVPTRKVLRELRRGVDLDDGPARVKSARIFSARQKSAILHLVLTEGRKREVRRLCKAVGHPVRSLRRIRFGPIELGRVPTGGWRDLTWDEIESLRSCVAGHKRSGKLSRRSVDGTR